MSKTAIWRLILLWLAWVLILVGFQKVVVTRFAPYRPDKVIGWTQTETSLKEMKRQVYLSDPFLNELVAWDSEYYLSIAVMGYDDPQVDYVESSGIKFTKNFAFFPLYPLLVRLLAYPLAVAGMTPIATATLAGLIVSVLGTLAGMFALFDLALPELGEEGAYRAVYFMLIFPTGFFLAQIYTEGLFIGLAFSALALLRRSQQGKRYLFAAAVLSALAILTRAVGGALVAAIMVNQWFRYSSEGKWKAMGWGALASLIPLATYGIWYVSRLGEGFHFVEKNFFGRGMFNLSGSWIGWSAAWNILTGNLSNNIPGWMLGEPAQSQLYYGFEFLLVCLGLLATILVWKKHPAAAAYGLFAWAIAVASGTPQSNIRYMLVIPANFLLLGRLGKNPVFERAWTMASLLLMSLLTVLYSFDFWVA